MLLNKDYEDYKGFVDDEDGVYVNLCELWRCTRDVDEFIKAFTETYVHENVHILVRDNLEFNQEFIVRKLLKQPFPKRTQRLYN